jgi:hypothetical protein
VQNGELILI